MSSCENIFDKTRTCITTREFAWLFSDKDRAYAVSEMHFSLFRILGGVCLALIVFGFFMILSMFKDIDFMNYLILITIFLVILLACKMSLKYREFSNFITIIAQYRDE